MVSPLERQPSPPSPSFDSLDLADDDDRSLAAGLDRALTAVDRLRDRPGASAFMAIGALALLAAAWWLGRAPGAGGEPAIPMVSTAQPAPTSSPFDEAGPSAVASAGSPVGARGSAPAELTTTTEAQLLVHVAGAVARPGIVGLRPGDRIGDAVEAAGGPLDGAEIHRLNLAAPVVDGMQVRVPTADEPVTDPAGVPPPVTVGGSDSATAGVGGLLDVNRADGAQLESLHGIGPSLAAAIVAWRTDHGPFATVDELLEVPGIGPAKLDGLIDQVTV